ncbi:MAG: hypothetical protein ABL997_21180 [Planctomycetota bacterium]
MRFSLAALLFSLVATELDAQQLWHSQNDNTTWAGYAVGWPASVLAFRFTAPSNANIAAAQVFTGNAAPAPHTLELRTHDTVTGLPGALLGAPGTWTTEHVRCWQGPLLPQTVALTGGQDYWLVWRVTGMFHQHSISADTTPGNVLSEVRISDGNTWHAQATMAAKFRLFTTHAVGVAVPFGTAKPGTYGDPTIGSTTWPAIGSTLDLWLDNAVRRQPAILFLGSPIPTGIAIPGIGTTWTTADVSWFVLTSTQSSPFVGGATLSLTVPDDPGLVNVPFAFQWAILDPLAADGIAHTAAIEMVVM